MKNSPSVFLFLILLFLAGLTTVGHAENTWGEDYALRFDATISSGTSLTLQWEGEYWSQLGVATQKLYRRSKGSNIWGTEISTLTPTVRQYTDTVVPGTEYEYQIVQNWAQGVGNYYQRAKGYLSAGITLPAVEARGKLLLLVDASQAAALAPEIAQLQQDLAGDGWTVLRTDLPRETVDASVPYTPAVGAARLAEVIAVKNVIKTAYNADPANVRAVYLLGHLPIPCGNGFPDGHPDHVGATPADNYYGDMTGVWTDSVVNQPAASYRENRLVNVPGDGKFDQSTVFSSQYVSGANGSYDLGVGRVDMVGMTKFPNSTVSETELLRRYLRKAHDYRHKQGAYANLERRALLYPWAGAPGGLTWASMTGMFGAVGRASSNFDYSNTAPNNWFEWQEANPTKTYMVGVAAGGGNYEGASSIGSSQDFGSRASRVVFLSMYGSYFGDFAATNCFLKAPLAGNARGDSLGLSTIWNGPTGNAWYTHQMGMGQTLADMARLSFNNRYYETTAGGDPITNYGSSGSDGGNTNMNLLGDPALRWYPMPSLKNLQATSSGGSVNLTWAASTEPGLLGYLVYRGTSASGPFVKLTASPLAATNHADATGTPGTAYTYMVRALKLETVPGGSFLNLSIGVFATITANGGATSIPATPTGLTASATNSTTINLTWADNAANETGYRIERRSGGAGNFTSVALLAAGATSHTDAGPVPLGSTLYYRVIANGSAGDSLPSNEAFVDGAAGFVEMTQERVHAPKSTGYVDLIVRRFGGNTGSASVQYATANSSALAGTHYTAASGTLAWADGDASPKTVRVNFPASGPQLPRSFKLTISNATGASLTGTGLSALILIEDSSAPLAAPWQSKIVGDLQGGGGAVGEIGGEIGSAIAGGDSIQSGRYIYQQITGDKTMVVKIDAPSTKLGWEGIFSSGIAVRSQLDDPYGWRAQILVGETPGTGTQFSSYDSYYDANPVFIPDTNNFPESHNTITGPVWLRLTRLGDSFTAETSSDGTTWALLGNAACVGMPQTAYWCLYHSNPGYYFLRDFQFTRFSNIAVSNPVIITPNAPTNLSISSSRVSWQHAESMQSGFKIERRIEGNTTWTQIGTATASPYRDTAVGTAALPDTAYEYRVRAYNSQYDSPYSAPAVGVTQRDYVDAVYTPALGQGADATIENGASANINFGNGLSLNQENTAKLAKSYLRFDLSGHPSRFRGAIVKIEMSVFDTVDGHHDVYALPDSADGWNESTINWNNAPANDPAGSGFLGGTKVFYSDSGNSVAPGGPVNFFSESSAFYFWYDAIALDNYIGTNGLLTLGVARTTSLSRSGFTSAEHPTFSKPTLKIFWYCVFPLRASFLTGNVSPAGTINLQWKDSAADETGFRVEVSTNGGTSYSPLTTTAANVTSFTTSSLPSVAGNHLYRVVAFNAVGDASPSLPVTLAPFAGLSGIQLWMLSNNLPLDGTGNGSITACPAGDGIMNLMKYALGINANTSGYQDHISSGRVNVSGSEYLTLSYTRPEPAPLGIMYLPETCSEMASWSSAGVVEVSSNVSGGLRTVTVRDGTAIGTAPRRFLRLKVTSP